LGDDGGSSFGDREATNSCDVVVVVFKDDDDDNL